MRKLRIFVASPGDIREERDTVTVVVDELRRTIGTVAGIELEVLRWETHAWPDIGDDAQDVINREISDFDVLVGIMWKRFGTPTKRAESGTGEEFDRAYDYFRRFHRPKIMFYFRRSAFYTTDSREWKQFSRVLDFRKKLERLGVLFWEYGEPIEFERRVREHLIKHILELTERKPPESRERKPVSALSAPTLFLSYKRDDLARVEPVYESLRAAGFQPWLDVKDILPGKEWKREIEFAIRRADFFLAFVSRSSAQEVQTDTSTYATTEVSTALEVAGNYPPPAPGTFILPVRLDPVQPPYSLSEYQWVDLFAPGGLSQLVSAVRTAWSERLREQPVFK